MRIDRRSDFARLVGEPGLGDSPTARTSLLPPIAERDDYGDVVLHGHLGSALARFNPDLPDDALEDTLRAD